MNENQINEITQQVDGDITPTKVEYDEFTGANVYGTEPTSTLDGGQEELIDVEVEEIEQPSDVEMIEGEPMTDATGSGTEVNHALLYNREATDQHPIGAITGLSDRLKSIETVKRNYGKGSSYAEFRKWSDSNPNGADRSGYFVYMVPNSETIDICDESREIYGVTTTDAAFVGNQVESDRSDDWAYAMVSLVGAVRVRTDGSARVGEYVVPNHYGEATLSENNYGYKVLSLGSYASYNYVVIALVPQNSALNKILGSLSGGEFELGDILLEIEGIKGTVNDAVNNSQIAIDTSNMTKGEIEDILGELENQKNQITTAQEVSQEAKEQAEAAEEAAVKAQSSAATSAQAAQSAKNEAVARVNQALSEVSSLKDNMQPLAEWSDPETGAYGIAGFVAQANADHTTLATIVAGGDDDGSDLAAIKQTKDIIQHLVSHMDRYAVGEYSLSYGLSAEEAAEILTEEYIYVATSDHIEQMSKTAENGEIVTTEFTFKRSYAYTWDPETDTWTETAEISTATEYKPGTAVGDLWYCWQPGITQTDENGEIITTYDAGTLYRWYGSEWIAVATMADNYQSRITSSVKQTADSLQSDVVALDGSVSTMRQDVDSITTLVGDDDGNVSSIIQRVGQIEFDIYNEKGTISSIQQQVTDNEASIDMINTGRFHVVYQSFLEVAPPAEGNKYSQPPMWDDAIQSFVFNDTYIDENGTYYFINDDHTKYCCVTGESSYDIYTIGHQVTSMINSRVTDTESAIQTLTKFVDDFDENLQKTETITGLTQRADANEAEIDLVASRYDHIRISVSADEVPMYGTYKYIKPPTWNGSTGKYEFDIADRSDDGTYYIADDKGTTYCNVVTATDGTVLYETYGLAGGSVAALQQKVDENSTSIGMVVDKDGVKGSAIIQAINGESTATIKADKIDIEAALGGMTLSATNGEKSSTITLTYGETSVTSDNIQFTGDVVFKTDLATEGATQIHGGNIITDTLEANFASIGGFKIGETALYNNQTAYLGGTSDDGGDIGGGDDSGDDEIVINAVALTLPETEGSTLDNTTVSVASGASYSVDVIATTVTQPEAGDTVEVQITLTAHDGYTFASTGTATVNSKTAIYTYVDSDKVSVDYTFTATSSGSGGDEGGDDTGDTPSVALPTGYTQVEYIESDGSQYIDTGVTPNYKTRIVMDAQLATVDTDMLTNSLYGATTSYTQSFGANWDVEYEEFMVYSSTGTASFSDNLDALTRVSIDHSGKKVTINDVTQTLNSGSWSVGLSLYLFAENCEDMAETPSAMKLYSCQIYDGENLIRDFVPCVNSSGVAGLYDTVEGEFYAAEYGTNFEAGPVVSDGSGEGNDDDQVQIVLPDGYTYVPYIESTGTQYINTFINPTPTTKIVLDAQLTSTSGASAYYGAFDENCGMMGTFISNGLQVGYGTQRTTISGIDGLSRLTIEHQYDQVLINGTSYTVKSVKDATCTNYLYLCTINQSSSYGTYPTKMKLYSCQIYLSGSLVRDFVPCINSSGVAGLYDLVNNAFYTNAGTGVFITEQSETEQPEDSGILPTGYKQLEYIESDGAQYIDTGVVADNKMSAEFTVQSRWADENGTVGGAQGTNQGFNINLFDVWANTILVKHGYDYTTTIASDTNQHKVIFNSSNVSIDGKTFTVVGNGGGTNTCYLFGFNNNGTVSNCGGYKLYQMKMYSSGTLVRDFVPGINPDGVVGLYDMVNNVFYANQGTGSFGAGPTVTTVAVATFATRAVAMATVEPGVYLGIDGIGCGHGNFYVDNTGYLYANNVSISGNITATGGKIGGFTIDSDCLWNNQMSYHYADYNGDGVYLGTDGIGCGNGNFYVTKTGSLHATNATITGHIDATSGTIGSCSIVNGVLQVPFISWNEKPLIWAETAYDSTRSDYYYKLYVGANVDPTAVGRFDYVQIGHSKSYLGFFGSDGMQKQHISRNTTAANLAAALVAYGLFAFGD